VTCGTDASPTSDVALWQQAINDSAALVRTTNVDTEWFALIGPDPRPLRYEDLVLDHVIVVGPVAILPATTPYFDYVRNEQNFIHGSYRTTRSHPLFVEGHVSTFDWYTVGVSAAASDATRMCALLTLASGYRWILRLMPQLKGNSRLLPPRDVRHLPSPQLEDQGHIPTGRLSIPDWFERSWPVSDTTHWQGRALLAHYEGTSLQQEHPSFAAAAYVSAVETIGEAMNPNSGSRGRFREALESIPGTDDLSALDPYGSRSGTVHGSRLFGSEPSSGLNDFAAGFFEDDHTLAFEMGVVNRLRQVSRELLIREFNAQVAD